MKRESYNAIIKCLEGKEFDFEETLNELKECFPSVRSESLRSILTQQYSKEVKNNYKSKTFDENKRKKYYEEFQKSVKNETNSEHKLSFIIVDIAKKNRLSPAITAKIILTESLGLEFSESDKESKKYVKELLANTNLIPNGKLALEVWRALLEDEYCGYYSECIKSAIGNEYEKRLKQNLRRLGISFQDEHDLRTLGFDKTPDVVLDVPFATKDGAIINWIDSKAYFGNDDDHEKNLKEQLRCYWNRFGTGLVIYWFGFISDLLVSSLAEGILILDSFPSDEQIILMKHSLDISGGSAEGINICGESHQPL